MTNTFGITQNHYRFYADDGSESGSTALNGEDTATNVSEGAFFHLRIGVQESGQGSASGATTDDYQLQVALNGGGFSDVTTTSTVVKAVNSANLTDSGATTQRLTAGSGSFIAGEVSEDGLVDDWQLTANNHSEHLFSLQLVDADVSPGQSVTFRLLRNGAVFNTYSVTPTLNVTAASSDQGLTGSVFTKAPTFPTGTVFAEQRLTYTFEGGSDETTITTSDTGSGDAFDVINIPAQGTSPAAAHAAYDTAYAAAGSLGGRLQSTDAGGTFVQWSTKIQTTSESYTRAYLKRPTSLPGNRLINLLRTAVPAQAAGWRFNTSGNVVLIDAGSTARYTSTKAFSSGEEMRIEFHVVHSATTGHMEARLFYGANLNGTTADETLGNLTDNWDTGANVAQNRFGQITAAGAGTNEQVAVDALEWNNFTWPGPVGVSGQDLTGTVFQKAPTFPQGAVTSTYDLAGSVFTKAPTFPQGAITSTRDLAGATFQKAPTFPQGAVTSTFDLAGSTFQRAPTFPQGAVAPGAVNLAGTTFTKAPTFPGGSIAADGATQNITGTTFQKAPTFPQGAVVPGAVDLAGTTFTRAPTFPTGLLTLDQALGGVTFQRAPTFPQGTVALVGADPDLEEPFLAIRQVDPKTVGVLQALSTTQATLQIAPGTSGIIQGDPATTAVSSQNEKTTALKQGDERTIAVEV